MDTRLFGISLVSAIMISIANLVIKANVSNNCIPNALFFRSISMLPFTSLTCFLKEDQSLASRDVLSYIFIASIFGYIGVFYFFKALQLTSTPGLIAGLSSCSGLTVLLFGIFFGFPILLNSLPGITLVTLGLVAVSTDLKDLKKSSFLNLESGIPYILLTVVFFGAGFNMLGVVSKVIDPALVFFVINIYEIGFSSILLIITRTTIALPSSESILPIFTYGFFLVFGFGGQMYAMSKASPGLVSSVVSSSSIFSLILANLFMGEKLNLQKYIAMAVVFCGLVLINMSK